MTKQAQDYYAKPMNCPMHNLIFASRGRSYRELPLRLFEFGTVYRYEKSGVIQGLTRARGFTQDDAHIYCTEDQLEEELTTVLEFIISLLRDYGLDDFYLELSTKDPNKFVGSDEIWEKSTAILQRVADNSGLDLVPDPGGAASTVRRFQCRRAMRLAAPGKCLRCSWTSTCQNGSTWNIRPLTARRSAQS